jgi:hypothetical protein
MGHSTDQSTENEANSRRYFTKVVHPNASRLNYMRWLVTNPMRSRRGARIIANSAENPPLTKWLGDFDGRKALVVGTGPSLDRVGNAFFDQFDAIIYVNFAIRLAKGRPGEYFFTTDIGPLREFIERNGDAKILSLPRQNRVFAPIFFDQVHDFTREGLALTTIVAFDRAEWHLETRQRFGLNLPFALRYRPCQPEWTDFTLPPPSGRMPVLETTSALSATLFAAMNGAVEVGLIGCDFSAGRAGVVKSDQSDPGNMFSRAIDTFEHMSAALARQGVAATNHSWLV